MLAQHTIKEYCNTPQPPNASHTMNKGRSTSAGMWACARPGDGLLSAPHQEKQMRVHHNVKQSTTKLLLPQGGLRWLGGTSRTSPLRFKVGSASSTSIHACGGTHYRWWWHACRWWWHTCRWRWRKLHTDTILSPS